MNILKKTILSGVAALSLVGCNKWLDVVPDDGIATVEMAFNLRNTAIRYLASCYSYMTLEGDTYYDPAMLGSDELWDLYGRVVTNTTARVPFTMSYIARGNMTASSVYANDWLKMYQGIRTCDYLIDNVDRVPDMDDDEKTKWKAEAKFLKAYYHFNLIKKWGPIPVTEHSLPIDSDIDEVRVYRDNIDDCFNFVLNLLAEAQDDLPMAVASTDEYGRVTKPICAALRAKVAVYAASPLFNGNDQLSALVDNRGVQLFPSKTVEDQQKRWETAVELCKQAIDICQDANITLYDGSDIYYRLSDETKRLLTLRKAFYSRWNTELIWGNTQSDYTRQAMYERLVTPILNGYTDMLGGYRFIGVPLKVAEQFYTVNGLPIAKDYDWQGVNTMELKQGDDQHAYYIQKGYTTCRLNFDREPRFYSTLGFDGGTWLGQLPNEASYNGADAKQLKAEEILTINCRIGGNQAKTGKEVGPVTGYFPKKHIPLECTWTADNSFTYYWYPYPIIRLSDLYLLYAEAINEAEGPSGDHSEDLFKYLNAIRERAGIPDVKTSWDNYSTAPGYYKTKPGMRDILHAERLNELALESQRFWDLRRWKEAPDYYQKNIYGYDVTSSQPEDYYTQKFIYEQPFGLKNYFWPIPTSYIEVNPNLVQNIGW